MDFSPSGLLAALVVDGHYGELVLINPRRNEIVASLTPAVHDPQTVTFSPNGKLIAIGGVGIEIIPTAEALTYRPELTEPETEYGLLTDPYRALKQYFQ